MKNRLLGLTVLCCMFLFLTGCGEQDVTSSGGDAEKEAAGTGTLSHATRVDKPTGDYVEIKDKLFIAQSNDIYLNKDDYLGKTICYEGMFFSYYDEELEEDFCMVFRYGPGCCGYDGIAGFEVVWEGDIPEDDSWVEVIGILEEYDVNGFQYIRLSLTGLAVLEERGQETVST